MEMHARRPEGSLNNLDSAQVVFSEGFKFYSTITATEMRQVVQPAIEVAKKIGPAVCKLDDIHNKRGFMLGITKNIPDFPMVFVEIGHTWAQDIEFGRDGKRGKYIEFAMKKADVIRHNQGFISSRQNLSLPRENRVVSSNNVSVPDGALLFNEWIISVSAFKNASLDTATALSIAVGSGLISPNGAKILAQDNRVDCNIFINNMAQICVEPIYH